MPDLTKLDLTFFSDYEELQKKKILSSIEDILAASKRLVTTAHNPSLINILEQSFDYIGDIAILKKENIMIGYMPFCLTNGLTKKIVSMPHFSYGGYIGIADLKDWEYKQLFEEIRTRYKANILIRDVKDLGLNSTTEKVSYFLNLLDSRENQFNEFSSKLRSQIRKASKNSLSVEISTIDEFYPIYLENMHRLGSPHLSRSFFEKLINGYSNGEVIIFVVKHDGLSIGSGILLTYKSFCEVTWAATYAEYNHLATNMILYWKMIEYAIENKCKIFSFGRASKDSGSEKFKKQWGGERVQLFWNSNHLGNIKLEKFTFLTVIWRYLPKPIIKYFGPLFTKYVY
jgi:hypothetical protein